MRAIRIRRVKQHWAAPLLVPLGLVLVSAPAIITVVVMHIIEGAVQ